jgi:HEAT repeat protein
MRKIQFIVFCALLLSVSSLLATPDAPRDDGQNTLQSVLTLLNFHHSPSHLKEAFQKVGTSQTVVQTLKQIALDGNYAGYLRSRAITALTFYPNDTARQFYIHFLKDPTQTVFLRRKALEAMEYAFHAEALPFAIANLGDADVTLRETAMKVVVRYPTIEGIRHLQIRLSQEKSAFLRQRLTLKLQKLQTLPQFKGKIKLQDS